MIENLEALIELHKQGTMAKAAARLGLSQSAVSKRIAAAENYYGVKLIERSGRNVRLTDQSLEIISSLVPLLAEVRALLNFSEQSASPKISIAVSEAILSSWGAAKIEESISGLNIELEYHSHKSPTVIERVESGLYDVGICSGKAGSARSLISEELASEEMVLVANHPKRLKSQNGIRKIYSVERKSITWRSISSDAKDRGLVLDKEVESFFSAAQLAKAGGGVALVPRGVAEVLSFEKNCIHHFRPKLYRPIQLIYRKSKLQKEDFVTFIDAIRGIES